jgi:hypothetical protein
MPRSINTTNLKMNVVAETTSTEACRQRQSRNSKPAKSIVEVWSTGKEHRIVWRRQVDGIPSAMLGAAIAVLMP